MKAQPQYPYRYVTTQKLTYCFTVASVGPLDPRGMLKALKTASPLSESEFITLYKIVTLPPGLPAPFDAMA
jgi:hypothetical protein